LTRRAFLVASRALISRVAAGGASCSVTQSSDLATSHHEIKALMLLSGTASDAATTYIVGSPAVPVFWRGQRRRFWGGERHQRGSRGIEERAVEGQDLHGHRVRRPHVPERPRTQAADCLLVEDATPRKRRDTMTSRIVNGESVRALIGVVESLHQTVGVIAVEAAGQANYTMEAHVQWRQRDSCQAFLGRSPDAVEQLDRLEAAMGGRPPPAPLVRSVGRWVQRFFESRRRFQREESQPI
jgi:hypothetical protein